MFRWLLNDEYVSVQVIEGRKTRHAHASLPEPLTVPLRSNARQTKQITPITLPERPAFCARGWMLRAEPGAACSSCLAAAQPSRGSSGVGRRSW